MMESTASKTINERILELVEDMGGPSEVARLMGVNPQLFYNLKNRAGSKPNSESLERFFSVAPRANANYIYKGIGPKWLDIGADERPTPAVAAVDVRPLTSEQVDWKARFDALEKKYDALLDKYSALVSTMASKFAASSFNPSSSFSPAPIADEIERVVIWGFGRYENPEADCKVLTHPAMATVVRPMYPETPAFAIA